MLRRCSQLAVLFFSFLLLFSSQSFAAPSFQEKDISDVGWSVVLIEVTYDAQSNSTTFTYSLTAASGEKDLSHWVLSIDIDETGLSSISPDNLTSIGLDPTTGVWGIKWDAGQDSGTVMEYGVTVPGNASVVDINYAVKGGTYYAVGVTQGPGTSVVSNDTYSISGTVFQDVYSNLSYDSGEPTLGNVSVDLLDVDGNVVATTVTNDDGSYVFDNVIPGDYTVSLPSSSVVDDFNETLFYYYTPVSSSSQDVTVANANVSDIYFGFALNALGVLDDLNSEDPDADGFNLPGEGRTIGYWKHQFSVAIKGKGRAHVDAATLSSYLAWIESFYLVDPFQFNDGAEFDHAHAIMANRTSDAKELLEKQLLGTELNHVAGLGLSGSYIVLQEMILKWSEYLSANSALFTRDELLLAKDILDGINNMGH
ncbi:MAG: hypothetical protein OEX00_02200 [Gammaproteobacteria bacterium]|nr:hypothetical protein [Gammaproteobacteria bacterium]MDH5692740.1 hypothetical protein [Gammaproteobacteria bacterium]